MALTISSTIPTQSEILSTYFQLLKEQNGNINPTVDPTLNILGNVYSGLLSGIYATIYLYGLNIFPQTASGQFLDIQLAEWGLNPRSAGTYALGTVRIPLSDIQPTATTFNVGDILTDSNNGTLQYTVMATTVVPMNTQGNIPIKSSTAASGYIQPAGELLNLQNINNNINALEVISLSDGSGEETDTQVQIRLLNFIQNYLLGGTASDYQNWCLQADTNVTGSTIVLTSQSNLTLFLLSGQLNINNLLSSPTSTYQRIVNTPTINNVAQYIEGKRPFTDVVTIESCSTYIISDAITINVQLAAGYNLESLITNATLPVPTITVKNLIKQEFRRAILLSGQNAQYLPQESQYYITMDTLNSQLSNSLSASTLTPGIYAQILLNFEIILTDIHGIVVPNPSTGQIIYDLLNTPNPYNNVTVGLLV